MSEKTLQMTMLYDFYGELLTEKQRECFDLYYNEDLSLAEIAEQFAISRQGVRDNLLRAETALLEYEKKTGLVERFSQRCAAVNKAEEIVNRLMLHKGMEEEHSQLRELKNLLESMKG